MFSTCSPRSCASATSASPPRWPARLPSIRAISNQIEQVFINLVLNAFDAMPEGGELWISIAQKRKMIEIIFQDTEAGRAAGSAGAHLPSRSSAPKAAALGLGLSVSYDIVTAHGGKLDLLPDRTPGAPVSRLLLPIHPAREMNA